MKHDVFIYLSGIVGIIGYFFSFAASFISTQEAFELSDAYQLSYLGIIIPNIVLEVVKYLCYKQNYKKIYDFDVISTSTCLIAIIIITLLCSPGESYFWTVWKEEFIWLQFPWFIMLFAYSLLLIFKSTKAKKWNCLHRTELPTKSSAKQ